MKIKIKKVKKIIIPSFLKPTQYRTIRLDPRIGRPGCDDAEIVEAAVHSGGGNVAR